jgi:signal transduction histidine kinase
MPGCGIHKGPAREWLVSPVRKTFAGGRGQRIRETVELANGLERPVIVHTAPIKSRDGKVTLVLEISADIGEIKRLNDKLEATRQSYRQLFDEVPCYITVQDNALTITSANKLFQRDFGAAQGVNCYVAYKKRDTPCPDCPVLKTFEDGRSHQSEMTVTSTSGEHYQVLISTAAIKDKAGRITGVMEMSTNITQIRQLQDHLSALGLKIGSVSHGIKGLLTGLDGGMYMVESGLSKQDRQKMEEGWEIVKSMVKRIRTLTLDILYFAKERELQWQEVAVRQFAKDTVDIVRERAATHGIQLVSQFDDAVGAIRIDPGVVGSALINILDNAVDACLEEVSGRPKEIVFRVGAEGDHILFEVRDNGVGMAEDTIANLFSRFYSSKGNRGTGLGLYISDQIVQQHGGKIDVTSAPGQGACFRITLPKTPPEAVLTSPPS